MKPAAKISSMLSVLVIAASVAGAEPHGHDAVDISGYYDGEDGELMRVSRNGEVYQVLYHYKTGDWIGVAIREGDNLAIGWHRSDGANLGVSLYKIATGVKGPTLTGGWAAYASGGIAKDAPTWSRKLDSGAGGPPVAGGRGAGGTADRQATVRQIMARNDANKDGIITREEATQANQRLIAAWDTYDLNKDGQVDATELTKALAAQSAGGARGGGADGGGNRDRARPPPRDDSEDDVELPEVPVCCGPTPSSAKTSP